MTSENGMPATRVNGSVMRRIEIECEYDCPHCHTGWVMGDDGIYTDDIEDECTTTCGKCGGIFQLRCVSVEVQMEATKVPADGPVSSE